MAMAVLSRPNLRRLLVNLAAALDRGLNVYRAGNPNSWASGSNKKGLLSDGFDISRHFFDDGLGEPTWRGRKLMGKKALFGIPEHKRAKDDTKRLANFMKTNVPGLRKADPFANHTELRRQDEVFLALQRRGFASMGIEKADDNHVEGNKETISVTFVDKDGEEKIVQVPIGMSMLEAAHLNDIELEGACEGSLACSTCHVIIMEENYYNKLQEPTDEENDMLDLAFGLTETSRLGCQVIAKPELDGMRLALPAATRNFAVDGYVAKPH